MINHDVVQDMLKDAIQEVKKKRLIEIAYRSRKIQNRKRLEKLGRQSELTQNSHDEKAIRYHDTI